MTPGFAKSRKELFWLPYPEQDTVLINAHNFTPETFDPSVNGKTPVSVWCPSLDTAGNGTSTLYDLVGSNHGTMTNMDAATDWVADTSSGGIRALDFDGSNDYVALAGTTLGTANFTISAWFKTSSGGRQAIVSTYTSGDVGIIFDVLAGGKVRFACVNGSGSNLILADSAATYNDGNWHFAMAVRDGSASAKLYVDGTVVSVTGIGNANLGSGAMRIGAVVSGYTGFMAGRIDDVRIWTSALDSTDNSDLRTRQRGG